MNESFKELLSELILTQVKDPRIGLVTITSVRIAADMETAKVFYSVMGGEKEREDSRRGLESAKSFLSKTVSRELRMRLVPEIRFVYDDALDRSIGIEETLKKLHGGETEPKE